MVTEAVVELAWVRFQETLGLPSKWSIMGVWKDAKRAWRVVPGLKANWFHVIQN